jgi:hypothetical protein
MKEMDSLRSTFVVTGLTVGGIAALAALGGYVRREIQRRGYPSWDACRCDFKHKQNIYQVWFSRHERRGETVVAEERGIYLVNPALWLRRLLHSSAQVIAILNPRSRYLERVMLSPQEARQFAVLLRTGNGEDQESASEQETGQIVWRREILHVPRYLFDTYIRRLYPTPVSQEQIERNPYDPSLPALWDPHTDLPLPTEGALLQTPNGTRVDYIGWTPSQISYCTARLKSGGEILSI